MMMMMMNLRTFSNVYSAAVEKRTLPFSGLLLFVTRIGKRIASWMTPGSQQREALG